MPRQQRVSVKGRGTDLFFPTPATVDPEGDDDFTDASTLGSKRTDMPTSAQASMHAIEEPTGGQGTHLAGEPVGRDTGQGHLSVSMHARTHARELGSPEDSEVDSAQGEERDEVPAHEESDALTELWAGLSEPAPMSNAFRFTEGELSRLTDVVYELSKRHSTKLAKQDVVRLALDSLLLDYEREGDASLLGRYVLRKKQWRRGGA